MRIDPCAFKVHFVLTGLLLFSCTIDGRIAKCETVSFKQEFARHLERGDLRQATITAYDILQDHPNDDTAQYALGVVRVLQSVEHLSQSFHKHGMREHWPTSYLFPIYRFPVPNNKDPDAIDYKKFRVILQTFIHDMELADKVLAKVEDPAVKLPIRVGMIRLDLDGDGEATEKEMFWKVFANVAIGNQNVQLTEDQKAFLIHFDLTDVYWLRGYTHLLRGIAESYLAYDSEQFFITSAHLIFKGAESPMQKLHRTKVQTESNFESSIAELILAFHRLHFEVKEPERLKKAHRHFLAMIDQSRLWLDSLQAEKDDDREWIPNPKQTGVLPMRVTQESLKG